MPEYDITIEEWRTIPDWPAFEVSNKMGVRRCDGHIPRTWLYDTKCGKRRAVTLSFQGRKRWFPVYRLVASAFLAMPPRMLGRREFVHHRDEDPQNDIPSNLQIMSPAAHASHHLQKWPKFKQCLACGNYFEPPPTKRARAKSCSPECKSALLSRPHSAATRAKMRDAAFSNGSAERAKTLVLHRWRRS
jgi:hypothetical protein